MKASFVSITFAAGIIGWVNAFWRLECEGSVALGRIDPLLAHGEASPHVHSVKGGSGESSVCSIDVGETLNKIATRFQCQCYV